MKEENLQFLEEIWRCRSYINTSEFLKVFISAKGPKTTKLEKFHYERCLCQFRRPSDTAALSSNELNLSKHCDVCQDVTIDPTFPSSSSSLPCASSICWNALSRLSHDPLRVPATIWSTVCRWKTESWKVRDFLWAMQSFILIHTTPQLLLCGCTARDGTCQSYLLKSRYPVKMTCMPKSVRSTMGFKGWQECEPAQNIYVWYLLLW